MLNKSLCLMIQIVLTKIVLCKNYTGYTLYKATPESEEQLVFLQNLTNKLHADFWVKPTVIDHFAEFIVAPQDKPEFFNECDRTRLQLTTVIADIQREFDSQVIKDSKRERYGWNNYYTLNETYAWLEELQDRHKRTMEILHLGMSSEGRPILAVKVLLREPRRSHPKSIIIIEGGIHGNEWASPAFVTYVLNEILTSSYAKDKVLRLIAVAYEWYFVPILNPDGYEYTRSEDRLWNKNRNNDCGVDLNTNFPYRFGTVGISSNKSSKSYCGPYPFSEAETRALRDFVLSKRNYLEFYISIHAFGQFLIIPYGYAKEHFENYAEMKRYATEAAFSISNKYGTEFRAGNHYETRGSFSSGSSIDWIKNSFKVPYVLSLYLRDRGITGYALPPDQILATCSETMDGLVTLLTNRTPKFDRGERKSKPLALFVDEKIEKPHTSSGFMKLSVMALNVLLAILLRN